MAGRELLPHPIDVQADFGRRRVNWNHARWQVLELRPALSAAPTDRLELQVASPRPRSDAGLFVALREAATGAWYVHPWACGLVAARQTAVIALVDFTPCAWSAPAGGGHVDDDGVLGCAALDAIAFGSVNPLGIGELACRVEACRLLEGSPPPPARLRLDGRALRVNQTELLPGGIFGCFNLPPGHAQRYRLRLERRIHHQPLDASPVLAGEDGAQVINTLGDRVRPSTRLTHPDWRERLAATAARFAAADPAAPLLVEFWNEPYLNWANRNRANFIPQLYDLTQAAEGASARIAHDGSEIPQLRWTRRYEVPAWQWCSRRDWRRGRDATGQLRGAHAPPYKGMEALYGQPWLPQSHPPEELAEGASYSASIDGEELELRAETPWQLYDETQFTHWSGAAMVPLYVEPLLAFAEPLKAARPEAVLIAGWGNRPSEDHWAAWELLYRPTIDAAWQVIDGICDHDYGGAPGQMDGVHETVCAYGMSRYGRWLHGYNTECANASDPQAIPAAAAGDAGASADWRKATWCARKILSALARVPDKARSQLHFGYGGQWFSDSGEGVVLDALRALRGRLLHVQLDQGGLLAVASVDGCDPACPRESGPDFELCLAVADSQGLARELELELAAPAGCRFADGASLRCLRRVDGRPQMEPSPGTVEPQQARARITLAPHGLAVWRLPLTGRPDSSAVVEREQVFAEPILQPLDASQPWRCRLRPPPCSGASRAWVRLVAEHLAAGHYQLIVGSAEPIPLPAVVSPLNGCELVDVEVPLAALGDGEVGIEIRAARSDAMPALLCALSLWIERDGA